MSHLPLTITLLLLTIFISSTEARRHVRGLTAERAASWSHLWHSLAASGSSGSSGMSGTSGMSGMSGMSGSATGSGTSSMSGMSGTTGGSSSSSPSTSTSAPAVIPIAAASILNATTPTTTPSTLPVTNVTLISFTTSTIACGTGTPCGNNCLTSADYCVNDQTGAYCHVGLQACVHSDGVTYDCYPPANFQCDNGRLSYKAY